MTENNIFLSIIIPSFNQGIYLSECLKSIFSQTFKNFEVLIIDNCSTDNTKKIINKYKRKYSEKIKFISKKDKGQSDAINKGIKLSRGVYITWQNADDYYYKDAFKYFYKSFKSYEPDVIYGNMDLVKIDKKIIRTLNFINVNFFHLVSEGMVISNQSCIWKKRLHKKYGMLRKYKNSFDYEWFLRISKKNVLFKKVNYNKSLSAFRIYDQQKSQNYNLKDLQIRNNFHEKYYRSSKLNIIPIFILKKISKLIRFFYLVSNFELKYILNYFIK